ncbi:MAG: S46 family peptidase [Alistipes indistinctus]
MANAWKKWQGEVLGINRLGTVASKRAYEEEFAAWAQDKPEYRSVVADLKAEYARIADAYFAREITRETLDALPKRYTAAERPKRSSHSAKRPSAPSTDTSSASTRAAVRSSIRRRSSSRAQRPQDRPKPSPNGFSATYGKAPTPRRSIRWPEAPSGCRTISNGCWAPARCATSTAHGSTNSTPPTSRDCASGTPGGRSSPTPT